MTLEQQLHQAISASVAIEGVTIGNPADKATWRVRFLLGTSQADQNTANGILASFNPADPATVTAGQTADAQELSRRKDILASIAWSIRFKDVAAWNALTLVQKRNAVLAEADNWRDIRVFIEKNL